MSDSYTGQIIMAAFNYAPRNFANCDGQLLNVNQNQALFALLGTTYGGDGRNTFALPDLRGRTPAGGFASSNASTQPPDYVQNRYVRGQQGGSEKVALTAAQNPAHTHTLTAAATSGVNQYLDGALLLAPVSDPARLYGPATSAVALAGRSTVVGGQPHENMQPFEVINFAICIQGIFPLRS
jgi:microcystin-dependent protein